MMASTPTYSISDLAHKTGTTLRTIRYYLAEGLLTEPETRGRYTRYSDEHVAQLEQIAHLKAQYLPLRIIRERLKTVSAGEGKASLVYSQPQLRPRQIYNSGTAAGAATHTVQLTETGLLASAVSTRSNPMPEPLAPIQVGQYQFFPDLPERLAATSSLSSAFWERIPLAPGIELHISEAATPQQREKIAMLVTAAHEILRTDA
jgi:DNA-binding transcriptional MerR regulator